MTKLITSKERVKHVHTDLVVYISASPENKKKSIIYPKPWIRSGYSIHPFLNHLEKLTLIFLYNFHCKQFAKISYRKIIAEILDDPKISRK